MGYVSVKGTETSTSGVDDLELWNHGENIAVDGLRRWKRRERKRQKVQEGPSQPFSIIWFCYVQPNNYSSTVIMYQRREKAKQKKHDILSILWILLRILYESCCWIVVLNICQYYTSVEKWVSKNKKKKH